MNTTFRFVWPVVVLLDKLTPLSLLLSKALTTEMADLRPILKKAGFLKRDPREKERKKYGLRSARKKSSSQSVNFPFICLGQPQKPQTYIELLAI